MSKFTNRWFNKGITIFEYRNEKGNKYFSIGKSFKDKATGAYKTSSFYYDNDLQNLVGLITQALAGVNGSLPTGTFNANKDKAQIPQVDAANPEDLPF